MSYRRFAVIPTSELHLDEALRLSEHATQRELDAYVRHVPEVYARLRGGATDAALESLRESADQHDREVGATYHHLFSPRSPDGGVQADLHPIKGLVVQKGRHRFAAARELGIDHLPVDVRSVDARALEASVAHAEQHVERDHPGTITAQRTLEDAHRDARGEVARGRDRSADRSRERD